LPLPADGQWDLPLVAVGQITPANSLALSLSQAGPCCNAKYGIYSKACGELFIWDVWNPDNYNTNKQGVILECTDTAECTRSSWKKTGYQDILIISINDDRAVLCGNMKYVKKISSLCLKEWE
jgi:hypothetical protein